MGYLSARWALAIMAAVLLLATQAKAVQFSVVADVSGGPYIGAINGNTLYGTVPYTGAGTLFSLSTGGTYKLLHNFNSRTDGSTPNGLFATDKTGNLYGTAGAGGTYGGGTLWKFSTAGVMTTLRALGGAGDGTVPMQGPTLGANGALYVAAGEGAFDNSGTVFSQYPGGAYKLLHKFLSGTDGHCPFSGVARDSKGTLYGTTVGHGAGGDPNGSIWKLTKNLTLTTLYVFGDTTDGEWPDQMPALDQAGNLYGTTHVKNGSNFAGVVWTVSAAGKFSVLHTMAAGTDGSVPNSPLLRNTDGNFYGTTSSGGASGFGTVFQITPSGTFSVMHSFGDNGDGAEPTGNLVHDAKGTIYGGTEYGPVFKIVP